MLGGTIVCGCIVWALRVYQLLVEHVFLSGLGYIYMYSPVNSSHFTVRSDNEVKYLEAILNFHVNHSTRTHVCFLISCTTLLMSLP